MANRLGLAAGAAFASAALLTAGAASADASAGPRASCLGQYFSSHAGLGAAHTGETVGSMTSGAARELRGLGRLFSQSRFLSRTHCGL